MNVLYVCRCEVVKNKNPTERLSPANEAPQRQSAARVCKNHLSSHRTVLLFSLMASQTLVQMKGHCAEATGYLC